MTGMDRREFLAGSAAATTVAAAVGSPGSRRLWARAAGASPAADPNYRGRVTSRSSAVDVAG